MANFPGSGNTVPSVVSLVETISRGASVPGGVRTAALLGEGSRTEILVSSAVGSGNDGLDETYSTTNGRDGRHFTVSNVPLVTNRSTVYKNGVPLVGVEEEFTSASGSFNSKYDYRLDINSGHIELQTAALVDLGGAFFLANSQNTGNGTISGLSLLDENALTETWTIRCSSVRRDGYGDPIDGYAKFIAQGSVSGVLLDGYGNQITWQSDGIAIDNGILQFSISEGSTPFQEGDKFTVQVKSGALSRGDSLVIIYICELDINDPEFFSDFNNFTKKHGPASTSNLLSLGGQLAFANSPPGIWAVQTAPPIPRRVSYTVEASASGSALADDLRFNLPINVLPDTSSSINFFVTDFATGVETQFIPNKVTFYDASYTASPNSFHFGSLEFSYTVVLEEAVLAEGDDAVVTSIGPTSATVESATVLFTSNDVGKTLKLLTPYSQAGDYVISSVTDGVALISGASFVSDTEIEFELIDSSLQTAKILFTDDLALAAGDSLRVTVIDVKDATFFDANWTAAYESLEKIECDIVVPLPSQTISSIFQAGRAHCEAMSGVTYRKERVLFIGAIQGLTANNVLGIEEAAPEDIGVLEGIQGDDVSEILAGNVEDLADYSVSAAYANSFRVVYFYPDEIVVQIAGSRTKVSGYFMAAAAAGYLSGVSNIAIPLTKKRLAGFTLLRDKMLRPIVIENLAAAGITVVQPVSGGGSVVWGKTTTNSGFPEEEELSIIFIRDRVAKSFRASFEGFIGTAETTTLLGSLMARANSVAQALVARKLITDWRDLRVERDSVDPRQYNVNIHVQPSYPVNWVYIKIGVGII